MGYVLFWENGDAVQSIGLNGDIESLEDAKRLAAELSATQQGVIIRGASPAPDGRAAWVEGDVAHYRDGKIYPAHYVITLDGLVPGDHETLTAEGARYRHTIEVDKGLAFLVDAESEHDARALLDRAFPRQADRFHVIEVRPATPKEVIDDEMGM